MVRTLNLSRKPFLLVALFIFVPMMFVSISCNAPTKTPVAAPQEPPADAPMVLPSAAPIGMLWRKRPWMHPRMRLWRLSKSKLARKRPRQ